jgi:hypothetical protein
MGDFDWLSGAKTVSPELNFPQQVPAQAGLLQNPDFLQMLAGIGSRLGGPGSVGEAIGVPVGQSIRAQQMAKEVGKQRSLMDDVLRALGGGHINNIPTSPVGDMQGIDSMTIDDKGMTIKMPRPGQASSYGTNKPLESEVRSSNSVVPSSAGGQNMRPFFNSLLG